MKPERVQLSRKRGWRMPPNTIKIDRSTRWGNPFRTGERAKHPVTGRSVLVSTREMAISLFALYMDTPEGATLATEARQLLKGRNLACWCKQGQSCHGDVLLDIANHTAGARRAA